MTDRTDDPAGDPRRYGDGFAARLRPMVAEAARRVPRFADRLEDADLVAGDLADVHALDRLPILSKDTLLDLQAADRPFGGFVADDARVRRVFQSPGPLYEPELEGPDPWRWAAALRAAGLGADDVVLNAFSYHLSPAGAMFEEAALEIGCTVAPGGVGNRDLQIELCADVGATAYIGLPSYLRALLERAEEVGAGPLAIRRAFVTAEPLPPSLREWLEGRVERVHQGYGTAETGNLGYECERRDGLHVPEDTLVTVCDLDTGTARWDGGSGQVVVTLLRPEYPLVRFGTGDLSAWMTEPCPCGRPTPRLAGFLGRVGEAVKVRGLFLHPRQVEGAMAQVDGVDRYRFVVDREDDRDVLGCEIVPAADADPGRVADAVTEQVRSALRFHVSVTPVDSIDDDAPVVEDRRGD